MLPLTSSTIAQTWPRPVGLGAQSRPMTETWDHEAATAFVEGLFAKHHIAFAPTLVMSSNETIKQAVMAGMAISLLSLHTVGREVATKAIHVLDVEDLPIVRRWYLVHRAEKRLSPAAVAFREFILGEAGAYVDEMMAPAIAAAKLVHRRLPKR